jgi:hypothetical protein
MTRSRSAFVMPGHPVRLRPPGPKLAPGIRVSSMYVQNAKFTEDRSQPAMTGGKRSRRRLHAALFGDLVIGLVDDRDLFSRNHNELLRDPAGNQLVRMALGHEPPIMALEFFVGD